MTAQEFLALVQQRGLVPEPTIEKLRQRLAAATKEVPADQIVQLLTQKGLLTQFQAQELLGADELTLADEDASDADTTTVRPRVTADDRSKRERRSTVDAKQRTAADEDQPLDDLLGNADSEKRDNADAASTFLSRRRAWSRYVPWSRAKASMAKRHKVQNPWDSPLMLVGGGALILLVIVGLTVFYLYRRGGGDQLFQLADDAYRGTSYAQAIDRYSQFLDRFPDHPRASLARVRQGLARLRQTVSSTHDGEQRLTTAKEVLEKIEDEPQFSEARRELAILLPEIAGGLADQARHGNDAATIQKHVRLATETLTLTANTNYVPLSFRPAAELDRIRDTLNLVLRDLERDRALENALASIRDAIAAGNTRDAYTIRAGLIREYSDLSSHEALAEIVIQIARAEREQVRLERHPVESDSEEAAGITAVPIADRRGEAAVGVPASPVLIHAQGAVYALDAPSGRLLWRRAVAEDDQILPVPVATSGGQDELLVDAAHDALLRVDARTGGLQWRLRIGERPAEPVLVGERILVATRSGKLLLVDPASGTSTEQVSFPQSLRLPPVAHPRQPLVYQLGEHSSLYAVSTGDWNCQEVFYLGHGAGTVRVVPTVMLRHVIVAENWGEKTSTLHVLAAAENGLELERVQRIPLEGHVVVPPIVDGRLLVVVTDRGQVKVFEVDSASDEQPLSEIAKREPVSGAPMVRYPLLETSRLWVADTQLTRLLVQAQSGQISAEGIEGSEPGAITVYPLQRASDLFVHVSRHKGAFGLIVSANKVTTGERVWQTRLAMHPVGEPLVDAERREIELVTTTGEVFRFGAEALQSGVHDQPQLGQALPKGDMPQLRKRIDLAGLWSAFAPAEGADKILVIAPPGSADGRAVRWLPLPGALACDPCRVGQGLVIPTKSGQVFWIDPATGKALAAPFQPPLELNNPPIWQSPCAVDGREPRLVIADRSGKLYLVGLKSDPEPHLVALAQSERLPYTLVTGTAFSGQMVCVAADEALLLLFSLPDLKLGPEVKLGTRPVWGPERVGDHVLVATEDDQLVCIDNAGAERWRRALDHGPLAGTPLADDGQYIITTTHGVLWRIDADSGHETSKMDLDQPLATGPVRFGQQIITVARDGTLLVLKGP